MKFIFLISLIFAFPALRAAPAESARRAPGASYLQYKFTAQNVLSAQGLSKSSKKSVLESAMIYGKGKLPDVTNWESVAVMEERFKALRDIRWLETTTAPGFLRRSSWLYPDDGCFDRASLAVMNLLKFKAAAPNKIFVFGDLKVVTPNSPQGEVSWWYHVAPIVQVNGEKYVLDPAIEPRHPLKLDDWLSTMFPSIANLEIALCGSGSYGPTSLCEAESDGIEQVAAYDQLIYLTEEWQRLLDLKRNPQEELGNNPPW